MIADRIKAYLASGERKQDVSALLSATGSFGRRLAKQFMLPPKDRTGDVHATAISHPCPVRAWHKVNGTPEEPLPPRTMLNFFVGDAVEIAVLALARLSGVDILGAQVELSVASVAVHPDGLFVAEGEEYGMLAGKPVNLEVKKVSSYAFKRAKETGTVEDTFGYATQASLECAGWRKSGRDVWATEFVLVAPETGDILSVLQLFGQALMDDALDRAEWTKLDGVKRPPEFDPVPETTWDRSKRAKVDTGRKVLCLQCSYCGFKPVCHPSAVMEVKDNGKPVWVVGEAAKFAANLGRAW